MDLPKIWDIPQGMARSGGKLYRPKIDTNVYERSWGKKKQIVPHKLFCPNCSSLTEYDQKWGEVRPKRFIEEEDYVFDLEYSEDESGESPSGYYVKCKSCGFDLREIVDDNVWKKDSDSSEDSSSPCGEEIVIEWIAESYYSNGHYYLTMNEFKRIVRMAYESDEVLKLGVVVGGGAYTVSYTDFDKAMRAKKYLQESKNGSDWIGIPRHYFSEL
tara:strand:+ start:1082 stop:1726 length:645 start_codon:yes stop_codon:yes gene_type:complete